MKKLLSILLLSSVVFSSCKKDDATPDPAAGITIDANGNFTPGSDAAGAMYAIYTKTYDDNTTSASWDAQTAYAWFGAVTGTKDAGTVTGNGVELSNMFNQYFSMDPTVTIFNPASGSVAWNVAGNTASGISAFTHTDNTTFPGGGAFTLPATINIANNFTLSHSSPGTVDAVVYSVTGNKGTVNKGVAGTSTSVTFTAAELSEAAFANDEIGFSIMPVKITSATYNGKKYYFVKQYQQWRATATL